MKSGRIRLRRCKLPNDLRASWKIKVGYQLTETTGRGFQAMGIMQGNGRQEGGVGKRKGRQRRRQLGRRECECQEMWVMMGSEGRSRRAPRHQILPISRSKGHNLVSVTTCRLAGFPSSISLAHMIQQLQSLRRLSIQVEVIFAKIRRI